MGEMKHFIRVHPSAVKETLQRCFSILLLWDHRLWILLWVFCFKWPWTVQWVLKDLLRGTLLSLLLSCNLFIIMDTLNRMIWETESSLCTCSEGFCPNMVPHKWPIVAYSLCRLCCGISGVSRAVQDWSTGPHCIFEWLPCFGHLCDFTQPQCKISWASVMS